MKHGKLIKDRYFHDDSESGLYFDLCPIKRQGGEDEGGLNDRIDETNTLLEGAQKCTLFLVDSQVGDLSAEWKNIFAPKTFIMVFRPGVEVGSYEIVPWNAGFNDGFLWSSPSKVFTKYDANALNHRFRQAKKEEVDNYLIEQPEDPPVIPVGGYSIKGMVGDFEIDLIIEGM